MTPSKIPQMGIQDSDLNTGAPATIPLGLSESAQAAWTQLCVALSDLPNAAVSFELPNTLALTVMPDATAVLAKDPVSWVPYYEYCLQMADQQARRRGASQTGVFFTPMPVAAYLVAQTVGAALGHAEAEMTEAAASLDLSRMRAIRESVAAWRIIDPACGTGVFLVAALQALHGFYRRLAEKWPAYFDSDSPCPSAQMIVQTQLAGVDVDPLSAWITEARLWQKAGRLDAQTADALPVRMRQPSQINPENLNPKNPAKPVREHAAKMLSVPAESANADISAVAPSLIRVGDTLSEPRWGTGFLPVDGWDFILGNPPYVSEVRGQAGRFRALQTGPYYRAKMDLCDAFLAWALDHLKPGGQLAYALPEYWTQRTSTAPLRAQLWAEGRLEEHWSFTGTPLFAHAPGHHSALMIWRKQILAESDPLDHREQLRQVRPLRVGLAQHGAGELAASGVQTGLNWLNPVSGHWLIGEADTLRLLAQLAALSPLLPPFAIQQGIVLPQGRLRPRDWEQLSPSLQSRVFPDAGIFLLSEPEVLALDWTDAELALLRPYYAPAGFQPFTGWPMTMPSAWLIYVDAVTRRLFETFPDTYARVKAHLERFAPILTSAFAPYGLHRPRQPIWFEAPDKILSPRQVVRPSFAVVPFAAYVNEGFYSIRIANRDPHAVAALLNSTLSWFWLYQHKRKGQRLQIDKDILIHFPAPPGWDASLEAELAALGRDWARTAQRASPNEPSASVGTDLWVQLDNLVAQAYGLDADQRALLAAFRRRMASSPD